jgi:phosphoglucosamine mutase
MDYNTTGDGIITALQVLAIMKKTGKRLSELSKVMTTYPQVLVNVPVREKRDIMELPRLARKVADAELKLDGNGRLLIRYSGTESKLRIMAEGKDLSFIEDMVNDLARSVKKEIG